MQELLDLIPTEGMDFTAFKDAARDAGTPLDNTSIRALRRNPQIRFEVDFEADPPTHRVYRQDGA